MGSGVLCNAQRYNLARNRSFQRRLKEMKIVEQIKSLNKRLDLLARQIAKAKRLNQQKSIVNLQSMQISLDFKIRELEAMAQR
jgi:hypothetical protein